MKCRGWIAPADKEREASMAAADLGTRGDLWPVKEQDMLTVIMQRLTALSSPVRWAGWMRLRSRIRNSSVPFRARIGLTEKYSSRLFDPSVRLAADIRDNEGRVFPRQGR